MLVSLGALAMLVVLDQVSGPAGGLTATFAIVPALCALLSSPRQTAVVSVITVAAAAINGYAADNLLMDPSFAVRLAIVAAVGIISTLAALTRARLEGYADRMELLAGVGEVVDGSLPLDETIERLLDTIVPTLADVCILDTVGDDGVLVRRAVRALPSLAKLEEGLAKRAPTGPRAPGATRVVLTGKPVLVEQLSDRILSAAAHDEEDMKLMRSARVGSGMFLPVRARGETLAAMTLLTTGARSGFKQNDLDFAIVLTGRIGLGLDNAGLSTALFGAEQRMTAIMGNLAEAVTVQDPEGRLIYANTQAARLMGCESVDEVLSAPPGELVSRFRIEHEDGRPVEPDELPGRRVLTGRPAKPLLVLSTNLRTGEARWQSVKATAIPDAAGRPILAVNVFEDVTEAKRAEFRQRFLMRASEALASTVEQGTTLQEVADLAVTEVSDWCSVHLVRGEEVELAGLAHVDPEKVEYARELHARYPVRLDDEEGLGKVLRTGESQLVQAPDAAMIRRAARSAEHAAMILRLDVGSVMHVPMKVADTTVGAIAFVNSSGSRPFDELDLALAEEIGRRAAAALENARLYRERAEVSEALQAGLLPPALPEMDGWSVGSLYRAAGEQTEVGGDFYDAFRVEDGWMVVVGDVAGRGAPAASLTALARYTIRTAGQLGCGPERVFELLNRTLRDRGDLSLCAVVLAHLFDHDGRAGARVVCAGSPPPLRLSDGGAEEAGDLGPFLGAFEDARWTQREVELGQGDLLVLYTDGILDAQGSEDRFGEARLRSMLKGVQGPREVIDRVERALDRFEVGGARDDTALVAVMRTAGPSETASARRDSLATGAR